MKRRRKATVINKQIIKDFMKENHLTQKQFAEKCNLSVRLNSNITKWRMLKFKI